jgi:hypothetical protein
VNGGVPSQSWMHGLECKRDLVQAPVLSTANNERSGVAQDLRLSQMGVFSIATVGMPAAITVGELWVSYDVELLKPKLPSQLGSFLQPYNSTFQYLANNPGTVTYFGNAPGTYTTLGLNTNESTFVLQAFQTASSGNLAAPTNNWCSFATNAAGSQCLIPGSFAGRTLRWKIDILGTAIVTYPTFIPSTVNPSGGVTVNQIHGNNTTTFGYSDTIVTLPAVNTSAPGAPFYMSVYAATPATSITYCSHEITLLS